MVHPTHHAIVIFVFTCVAIIAPPFATRTTGDDDVAGQDAANHTMAVRPRSPLDDEGRIVNFVRDIAPIFREHCLECHGPDDAKNDFRVDDPDSMGAFLEPGDVDGSMLFTDYLTTDDDDMLMPPRKHGGPLGPGELALVRTWITEGADWPEDAMLDGHGEPIVDEAATPTSEMSLLGRVWSFQGFLHPATVHFPIALLLVGALFVVLGWKWPAVGTQIPLACLFLGSVSSVAATAMGWSFAEEKGYGSWNNFDMDREIFWHRWSAIVTTVLASFFAVVALIATLKNRPKWTNVWKVGLLLVAGIVGLVGHQGGELTYGKAFYPKALSILFGTPLGEATVGPETTP